MLPIHHFLMRMQISVCLLLNQIDDITSYKISGNLTYWDSIFSTRTPEFVLDLLYRNELSWTEGPLWLSGQLVDDTERLIFSDTIENKIYNVDLRTKIMSVFVTNSGDSSVEDLSWRAEPGSNGMALLNGVKDGNWAVICQHGARRLAYLNLDTGENFPLIDYADNGKRLNGPNDVVVHEESDGVYVYFTDPVYAWLEKDRFEDLPYLDERVKNNGPGYCGVYRSRIYSNLDGSNEHSIKNVELISIMERPNGIGFLQNSHHRGNTTLVISNCCQGNHKPTCQQGTSRWTLYQQTEKGFEYISTISDTISPPLGGCSDGFKTIVGPQDHNILISSCSGGLCLVDIDLRKVVARLWIALDDETNENEEETCKVSNVALSPSDIYLTGNCGILKLPLRTMRTDTTDGNDNEL